MNDKQNSNSFESADDFEARIFSKTSEGNSKTDSFFAKLDRLGKTCDGYASNLPGGSGSGSHVLDVLDESFNTLSDGMDGKLKKTAMYFEYDPEEVDMDGYAFRPHLVGTYKLKNVRFLANFITEAGVIIKRSKISAKAQRKVAREIKELCLSRQWGQNHLFLEELCRVLMKTSNTESFDNPTADDDERYPLGY